MILETLNDKYVFLIKNFNIKQTYAKIVTWKPYKALSCFVYDWSYAPLRRGQHNLAEPITPKPSKCRKKNDINDLHSTFDDDSEFVFKSHKSFVNNLRSAQKTAFSKKRKVEIVWRGHKTVVEPSGPVFTTTHLRKLLLRALRDVMKKKDSSKLPGKEHKVNIVYLVNLKYVLHIILI